MIRPLRTACLMICLVTLGISAAGFLMLRSEGKALLYVAVDDFDSVGTGCNESASRSLASQFRSDDPRELLRQVMNSVEKTGFAPPRLNARQFHEHAKNHGGGVCSDMALLYLHVLAANGITAREIHLKRNIFDRYDTHATVEVKLDGRWVLLDPTFHCCFVRDGRLLGALEIHRALFDGTAHLIEPQFLGEVAYPARLEKYYIDFRPLYNNVAGERFRFAGENDSKAGTMDCSMKKRTNRP